MFYTVVELQLSSANGTPACITQIYTDFDDALAKMYTVLATAAKSALVYHACFILSSGGEVIDGRAFDRR